MRLLLGGSPFDDFALQWSPTLHLLFTEAVICVYVVYYFLCQVSPSVIQSGLIASPLTNQGRLTTWKVRVWVVRVVRAQIYKCDLKEEETK